MAEEKRVREENAVSANPGVVFSRVNRVSGWGRFHPVSSRLWYPGSPAQLPPLLKNTPLLARGAGRSYGDAAQLEGGNLICAGGLDHFHSFDPETGVLECEAGVTLDEIQRRFLPRGWMLPVTPGTRFVQLGGAVAADVHGKNHHRVGSLAHHLEALLLLTASGETVECGPRKQRDLFLATVGGMGLTGMILRVRLRLRKTTSAWIHQRQVQTRNLDETLELFTSLDAQYEYSVAWLDCAARGRNLGRGVGFFGNSVPAHEPELPADPLRIPRKRYWNVPGTFPGGLFLNGMSLAAFNTFYHRTHPAGEKLVDLFSFFYPLDQVLHWNRLYGRRGFLQYQFVVAGAEAERGLRRILETIAAAGRGSFLAVLKRFGAGLGDGLLSFPRSGYTLALDFPWDPGLEKFLERLDRLVLDYGGRVYLAKDARLRAGVFREMYPEFPRWREIRRRFDPAGCWRSDLERRLEML